MLKNGKSRTLQAIELESGVGRQLCLWKWASYCASEVKHALVFELCSVVLSINGLNFFIFFKFITLLCSQHIMLCKPKSEIDNIYVENC